MAFTVTRTNFKDSDYLGPDFVRSEDYGSGFWHWLVVNILPNAELALGAGGPGGKIPAGPLETCSDFGKPGYGGPCSPGLFKS